MVEGGDFKPLHNGNCQFFLLGSKMALPEEAWLGAAMSGRRQEFVELLKAQPLTPIGYSTLQELCRLDVFYLAKLRKHYRSQPRLNLDMTITIFSIIGRQPVAAPLFKYLLEELRQKRVLSKSFLLTGTLETHQLSQVVEVIEEQWGPRAGWKDLSYEIMRFHSTDANLKLLLDAQTNNPPLTMVLYARQTNNVAGVRYLMNIYPQLAFDTILSFKRLHAGERGPSPQAVTLECLPVGRALFVAHLPFLQRLACEIHYRSGHVSLQTLLILHQLGPQLRLSMICWLRELLNINYGFTNPILLKLDDVTPELVLGFYRRFLTGPQAQLALLGLGVEPELSLEGVVAAPAGALKRSLTYCAIYHSVAYFERVMRMLRWNIEAHARSLIYFACYHGRREIVSILLQIHQFAAMPDSFKRLQAVATTMGRHDILECLNMVEVNVFRHNPLGA